MKKNKDRTYSRRAFFEDGIKLSILGALYQPLQSAAQVMPFGFWKKLPTGGGSPPVFYPGKLFSWGTGTSGRLGTSATTTRSSPVQVGALTDWAVIAANSATALAVKSDGSLWAWGVNAGYQFGNGNTTNRSSPVQVGGGLTTWATVAFGGDDTYGAALAIKNDGTLWGWGSNRYCVLNPNSSNTSNVTTPVQFGTDTNWKSIAISGTSTGTPYDTHVHAIKTDGTMWSWGNFSCLGVLPNRPLKLGFGGWSKISMSSAMFMGVRTDGTMWGWGLNMAGHLADGTLAEKRYPVQVGGNTDWSTVAVSNLHVLALKTDNTLWTWGSNMYGELGSGLQIEMRSSPAQVGSLWSQVVVASADILIGDMNAYSMGIKTDGTLWGWGFNNHGQLGTTISPRQVGSSDWAQISVGTEHVLAIKTDGTLWAWGSGSNGVIGDGTGLSRLSPVQIGADTNWAKLPRTCSSHSAAIKTDGTLWTWGSNGYGQLGTGDNTYYNSPVQVGALADWIDVAVSESSTYGIRTGNTLWAWGNNGAGQLGNNTTTDYSSPVQVGVAQAWASISTSVDFVAALNTSGQLYMWGSNSYGQLGNGNTTGRSSPVQLGAGGWASVDAGATYVIARKTTGTLWAWGENYAGQHGTGSTTSRSSPVQVGALTDWSNSLACGWSEYSSNGVSLAIKSDGTLWTWGSNRQGQLGDTLSSQRSSPVQIGSANTWAQVSSRGGTSMAIRSDNTLWSWGNNLYGKLGYIYGVSHVALQVGSDTNWTHITTGGSHSLGIKSPGTLWAWGYNSNGQLGIGTAGESAGRMSPVQVGAGTNWVYAHAGHMHSAAIKTDGTLWTWGYNADGSLGHGNTVYRSSPVQVGTGTDWASVTCNTAESGEYTLAIKTNGTMWAWGANAKGELGDGTLTNRSSPVQIGSATWLSNPSGNGSVFNHSAGLQPDGSLWLWGKVGSSMGAFTARAEFYAPVQNGTDTDWKEVSAGCAHVIAIKTGGSIWGWGANNVGQLGLFGNTEPMFSPVQIGGATADWATASAGSEFTAAIKTNGTLWSWGVGTTGCLGDGTTASKSNPVQVGLLTNWKQVSCGKEHFALAVKTDGTLWAWGSGANGRLGTSSITTRSSPVQVGLLTTWVAVTASQTSAHGTQT